MSASREFKNIRQWLKYVKNPKYCPHVNGFWSNSDGTLMLCITCGKKMDSDYKR